MNAVAACGVAACAVIILSDHQKKIKRKRRWTRNVLSDGPKFGINLLERLKLEDGSGFRNFTRLTTSDFEELLQMVGSKISKEETRFRKTIPASLRLAVTLRFLASGDSFTSLMHTFRVSKQAISEFVPVVCEAIITSLKQLVQKPNSETGWRTIGEEFNRKCNFPHCLGSIDGKHVQIVAPEHSGNLYFNHKGTFSIVLLGIADANYNFLYADVGCQGRISDGSMFKHTSIYADLERKKLHVPGEEPLPGRTKPVPFVFVADDAFALSTYMMKPYPGQLLGVSPPERVYNYRLSRARRVIENVFGIMSSKFRVLLKPLALNPDKCVSVVLSCIYLHNFLRRSSISRRNYTPPGTFDSYDDGGNLILGSWRRELEDHNSLINLQDIPTDEKVNLHEIRNEFRDYFVST